MAPDARNRESQAHTDDAPYICEGCGAPFLTREGLGGHRGAEGTHGGVCNG